MFNKNFEIEESLWFSEEEDRDGYRIELNFISWFDKKPRYDIRKWSKDHERCKKVATLNKEEALQIAAAIQKHAAGRE